MDILKQFWTLLSGKKTVIGLAILAVLGVEGLIPQGQLYSILEIVGLALSGGGILHKFMKKK